MESLSRPHCITSDIPIAPPTGSQIKLPSQRSYAMATDQRASRLHKVFRGVLSGNQQIKSSQTAQLFLEAIRNQQSPTSCIETILSAKLDAGINAVHTSVRLDISPSFLLSHTLPFLRYISDPDLKVLVDGQLLQKLLLAIAQPPTVWNTLLQLFSARQIPDDNVFPFAWLALELVSLPPSLDVDVVHDVQAISEGRSLLMSSNHQVREVGYKIKKVLQLRSSPQQGAKANGPGGRHDNDFPDYRQISIYPTADEFLSTQLPFCQTAVEVLETPLEERARAHLDNQFRLLREDMLAELREDHQVAIGKKKGKRTSTVLGRLKPVGLKLSEEDTSGRQNYKKCTLLLQCYDGLFFLQKLDTEKRKKYLVKDQPNFLRHQAFGVMCNGKDIYGYAFVDRDVDALIKNPPVLSLQFTDSRGFRNSLRALSLPSAMSVQFVLVDTAVFAVEPVLARLQLLTDLPLQDALVNPTATCSDTGVASNASNIQALISQLRSHRVSLDPDSTVTLPSSRTGEKITVDGSQLNALLEALSTRVSLIQGPPGTGKSFIGAQIARFLFEAGMRILVISYTNHALDQFLEDLLKAGISESAIVRIGAKAKCTPATLPLALSEQRGGYKRSRDAWNIINNLRLKAQDSAGELIKAFRAFQRFSISWEDIAEYLEFSDDARDSCFFKAFEVPANDNGWQQAGKHGKEVQPDYLYQQWIGGKGPGVFAKGFSESSKRVWAMPPEERRTHLSRWFSSLQDERLGMVEQGAHQFSKFQEDIDVQFSETDAHTVGLKQIVGCTTTGAAKYSRLIRAAKPDVVLVEEAGEILESHVLTALVPTVKQLILIGDHKQLRPKINNYALSVEMGDGFDLNRSLFERLILQGAPHTTLLKQHRMVPEISMIPRALTYPELVDGPNTHGRPPTRGLRDRVVFLNHSKLEDLDQSVRDRRDPGLKESKKNKFEAEMALRCVRFFGQQGYGSDQMVILTPYLGQLREIRDLLHDEKYNTQVTEMDKADLIKAGLITQAAAKADKKTLRISTIDNYQGEESDIVIASLTRSNESGDIGFMFAPERLNVLVTRARNCLVLIGNMDTFMRSKKGRETWHPFFEFMKTHGHLYDGLPVKCEKHPDRTALLKEPIDFDKSSPDGGCTELCDAPLKCGLHKCKSRCHRVTDHSQAECNERVSRVCDRQHKTKVACSKRSESCKECILEDKQQERRIKRDLQLEVDRQKLQEAYARELQELDDEIDHQRRIAKYKQDEKEQKQTLEQRRVDLANMKDAQNRMEEQQRQREAMGLRAAQAAKTRAAQEPSPDPSELLSFPDNLSAKADWEQLKNFEGARSKPMDDLMGMIGLEDVKQEFLLIKSKVDLTLRQNTSLADERFSCSMLGNPGTGKTTVARLYAQFLTEVGVIPGKRFEETTGAALTNKGVSGCKDLIDNLLNDGGGVLFIDEAYQLTSGNNPGGGGVLDYLLAEVENLKGKVVFVLAGYNKQMESFFAHNPGLPSRFPIHMTFGDYTDDELLRILEIKINKKYNGLMTCEDGLRGLYCRIISRRLGRGRGTDGFGNARAVENTLAVISGRQANRLRRERRTAAKPDDMLLTKEDLIGPEPAAALTNCGAWKKLQELIGLAQVKEAVKALVDSIQQNYQRELAEQPPIQYSLNKVFLGNPGTGKTTVAKLYGEILASLGLLSRGEVVVKNPSDFVGSHLGESEKNTKGILASASGKVLVIDEAYGLYGSTADPYKTGVIDTIVAEVQSVPGDDRCVLLLGYKDQMEDMFQNVNPGLSRRFPIASAFNFDDFSQDELRKILDLKLKQQAYQATDQAIRVVMEMVDRARNRPNFGNAGEIDIILDATKARHQRRLTKGLAKSATILEAQDFDENFDRAEKSETNIKKLFENTVGCDNIVQMLEGYQHTVRTLKSLEMDPKENIPFNFLFRGPPGTGKTTTAKKMGKVFYDMGFLATAEVVECSATDLIGQFVGQTGPKVQQLLDKALGKVLFVDEAYRLAEGHYAKEAMDELVDSVTKEKYFKKLIIILAGYTQDINRLMTVNAGLTSRFPAVVDFRALNSEECIALLLGLLKTQRGILRSKKKELDISCLETPTDPFRSYMNREFDNLTAQDNWASARDVQAIGKGIFRKLLFCKDDLDRGHLTLSEDIIKEELQALLKERASRSEAAAQADPWRGPQLLNQQPEQPEQQQQQPPPMQPQPEISTATRMADPILESATRDPDTVEAQAQEVKVELEPQEYDRSYDWQRDAGVSDEVWGQLQRDRKAEQTREREYQKLREDARKATAGARHAIVKRLLEEERRRKEEEAKKKKLMVMGSCPMGFQWIKQASGYRCGGGSHYLSDGDLEKL
ncbi:P-loop containing nucleoside triphosphate hydrolase protein [Lasiosphaeria hispida]|uniref:P-loop containing nucleoside triphosphate hydrolase protein n=1 Tax=Lasiosphaeria hispida TaxID=260671 RepID=A0AAJ0M935_9PEZI|nr:P-loop containing nucleoside triphosphate hydrolase protein [Lasiosphaeria hispida]